MNWNNCRTPNIFYCGDAEVLNSHKYHFEKKSGYNEVSRCTLKSMIYKFYIFIT